MAVLAEFVTERHLPGYQLADRGAGVLVVSSEIEELIRICDRLLVMCHGEIRGEFRREEFDREKILAAALPASKA